MLSRCNESLRAKGVAYPRTCEECGLGPCKAITTQTYGSRITYTDQTPPASSEGWYKTVDGETWEPM